MDIDIILRTHDKSEVHPRSAPRYCGADKNALIKKCVSSLVLSCNEVNHNIKITCLNDHSTEKNLENLNYIFSKSKHETIIKNLERTGQNESSLAQFTECKNSSADLVYSVEDDYLHTLSAIEEMIGAYTQFKEYFGTEVAIHPFDDPDNYKHRFMESSQILLGKNRHWRTNTYTTFTFLCNPSVIKNNWNLFYRLAKLYMTPIGEASNVHEGTTINKIWREQIALFTPMPSLALHMQYEEQKDKYIDWKSWWNQVNL